MGRSRIMGKKTPISAFKFWRNLWGYVGGWGAQQGARDKKCIYCTAVLASGLSTQNA